MQAHTSAVEFATKMRAHIALASADLERSITFYSELFEMAPTKVRRAPASGAGAGAGATPGAPRYAKFELAEPPLNLTLNYSERPPAQATPAHFGVQVKSTGEVMTKRAAMQRAGFDARTEAGVGCCYAVQDKVWFEDPDANQWEVFVVTQADIPEHSRPAMPALETPLAELSAPQPETDAVANDDAAACCPPSCCQ